MSAGANFRMKTIARDLSAEQVVHKMLALQKSAQFSEVRVLPMSNSKTRFMIGGYRWPSRQTRRRYGVGKTKNPSTSVLPLFGGPLDRWELPPDVHFSKGDVVSLTVPDNRVAVAATITGGPYTKAGSVFYKVRYTRPTDNKPIMRTVSERQIASITNPVDDENSFIPPAKRRYDKGDNVQFQTASYVLAGIVKDWTFDQFRGFYYDIEVGFGRTGSRRLESVHQDYVLAKLTAEEYATASRQNPSIKKVPTPNQVLFGQNGKTKVGWIHNETADRYHIAYREGAALRYVWRPKEKTKFVATGRYGRPTRNHCPSTANPGKQPYIQMTPALARAVKLSKRFHHFDPRTVSKFHVDWPKALTCIGAGVRIDYLCDKFDGKPRVYFHEFENLATVYVGDKPQADGTNLLIIKGKFRITQNGIEG